MFLIESKFQDCFGSFFAMEFSLTNAAMGMGDPPLLNGLDTGIEEYSQLIGKSVPSRANNLSDDEEKEQKRKRAKRANEIFRNIGKSAGFYPFFFDKFLIWSDYVEGKLNEEEFTERVREEVRIKAESLQN
jgi:hypothetical protein